MFEDDSADTFGGKFLLMLMGGGAEGLACADPEARTPIGASGMFLYVLALYIDMYLYANIMLMWCGFVYRYVLVY